MDIDEKEDLYYRTVIFDGNIDYYKKLKKLHSQKNELLELKNKCTQSKPFVIEFSGTPRTGKTTTINNLYDFLKKGGFKVSILEEFTTSKYYKDVFKKSFKNMTATEFNIEIIKEVEKQLKQAVKSDDDIIIIDRSINDRQIWNYRRFARGDMSEKLYSELKEKYLKLSQELIDFLVITYAEPLVSLKRDYNSSLALEKRNFLNIENIEEYNNCLNNLHELFKNSVKNSIILDTSSLTMNDVSVEIASKLMVAMKEYYR